MPPAPSGRARAAGRIPPMAAAEARRSGTPSAPRPAASARRRRPLALRLLMLVLLLGIWGGVALAGLLVVLAWDLPRPDARSAGHAPPLRHAGRRRWLPAGDPGRPVRRDGAAARPAAHLPAALHRRWRTGASAAIWGLDPDGHRPRRHGQLAGGGGGAGRLHPDAAAGQEPVPDARAHPAPQGAGGAAGAVAGAALHQGRAARDLPQPRLSRRRRLWRGCGGAAVFRRAGRGA